MEGNSINIVQNLLNQLKQVVPQAFTEDKLDFEQLKTLVGEGLTASGERYALTWAGKSEAYKVLQTATTVTLNPELEKSINWDETENVLIEGENLEVLKVLQKSYYGKIKMIYIDPPYNTGNDSFIYPDKFSESKEDYLKRIGDKDDEGLMMKEGLFRKNSKENGQFHSNWLNMMLPRLFLARNLLKEDGLIFVSIDDNEQANLKLLMDEIFGEENFIGDIIWNSTKSVTNTALISVSHTYNYVYCKNIDYFTKNRHEFRVPEDGEGFANPDNDPRGVWKADPFQVGGWRPNQQYEIINPKTGEKYLPNPGCSWKNDHIKFKELIKDNRIVFGTSGEGGPQRKRFLSEALERGKVTKTLWDEVGTTTNGTQAVKKLFDNKTVFTNPKPTDLIKKMLQLGDYSKEGIVLDFFAGSGTTAQAVFELNEQDGGNRKFICVQLQEPTEEDSEAKNAGFDTIAEITQERIKKVTEIIRQNRNGKLEMKKRQHLGFRKYILEGSNFKIWRGDIAKNEDELKEQLKLFAVPQRANATTNNMLWELLVKNGYQLTEKVKPIKLSDSEIIYLTQDRRLALVLDNFTRPVQDKLLEIKPKAVLMLDTLFTGRDNDKTNAQLKLEDNGISFKSI